MTFVWLKTMLANMNTTTKYLLAISILMLFTFLSLFIGVIELTPVNLFTDPETSWLLLVSRLPRALAVLLTGTSLAIAGLVMQILVQNRFVEPATDSQPCWESYLSHFFYPTLQL